VTLGTTHSFTSRAVCYLLGVAIAVSAVGGVTYGYLRSDWPGAFGLASLLIGFLTVLLTATSAGEYLGLERPVDDQVDQVDLEGGRDDLITPVLSRVFEEEAAEVKRV
jgi:hypothetical protein